MTNNERFKIQMRKIFAAREDLQGRIGRWRVFKPMSRSISGSEGGATAFRVGNTFLRLPRVGPNGKSGPTLG
jgi:hypothetical protein